MYEKFLYDKGDILDEWVKNYYFVNGVEIVDLIS